MNLDITLSINRKEESQHNTFLLKWNPAISSYSMERLDNDMADWAEGYWSEDFDWSVQEWQKAHKGDRFFMVRVGEGNTGMFAAGRFISEPFEGEDWSGKDRKVYYMQMEFEAVFHPERVEIIPTEELESVWNLCGATMLVATSLSISHEQPKTTTTTPVLTSTKR